MNTRTGSQADTHRLRIRNAQPRLVFGLTCSAAMLIACSGCAQTAIQPELVRCTEPRPEICTMDYTPVCALVSEAGTSQWKTYANACTACSDSAVTGYRENACIADEKSQP